MKKFSIALAINIVILIVTSSLNIVLATPLVNYEAELNYQPFHDVSNGIARGFDVDLSNLIFKEEDYTVNYSMGDWVEVYNNLKNSRIDTCGLVGINEDRKKEVLFSNVVLQFNAAIYTRNGFNTVNLDNIKEYKVAVGKDQYTEKILRDTIGLKKYSTYINIQEAIYALYSGEVDVLFENQDVVNYLLIKGELTSRIKPQATNLFPVDVAFAVSKQRPELIPYINKRLKALEQTGVYEELYLKYFFAHSKIYNETRRREYFAIGGISALLALIVLFSMQKYIKHLRKKIMVVNEELFKQYEDLENAHEELAITEEEIRSQYNQILESEEAFRSSEERFRLAFDGANDGLWDHDLIKKEILYSKKCKEMLGYYDEDIDNGIEFFASCIHPEYLDLCKHNIDKHFKQETTYVSVETRVRVKEGDYKWMLIRGKAIFDKSGNPIRMAGSLTDISERKKQEDIIYNMAYFDSLTGLANRTLFEESLNEAILKAKKNEEKLAVMFLDLDNFKYFNDNFGHNFGDNVLIKIGTLLKELSTDHSLISRLGGDEFIFMLKEIVSEEDVRIIASRILKMLRHSLIVDNREVFITASIGIALYPYDGTDVSSLRSNADTAMYVAKESGKNRYQFYTSKMNDLITQKLQLENDLRHALKRKEFVVYYQPKVDINTREIVGMEALVRWFKPGVGLISPVKFIALAEESGLIIPIGLEVLKTACRQNLLWQQAGYSPIRVAVNLSVHQFRQKNLVESILKILKDTKMEPRYLELEITESLAMNDFNLTINVLNKLQMEGIHISLDDFGTGYSSLNYLKNLPINTLKIDKSFVDDITTSVNGKNISKAVIMMAHSFGLSVVAEGVESEEQLEILKEQKCDIIQGYLFSKPVSSEEFEKMLKK